VRGTAGVNRHRTVASGHDMARPRSARRVVRPIRAESALRRPVGDLRPLAVDLARLEAGLCDRWATLLREDPARAHRVGQAARFLHQAIVALQDDSIA
jgi:hypothetical protein